MAKRVVFIHPSDVFENASSLKQFSDTMVRELIKQVSIFDLLKLFHLIPNNKKFLSEIFKRNPLEHQIQQLIAENWRDGELHDIDMKFAARIIWPLKASFWTCAFPSETKIQMVAATRPDFAAQLAKMPPRWKLSHCLVDQIETHFDPAMGKNWRLCAMMRAKDPRVLLARVEQPSDEERDFVTAWTVEQTWRHELPDLVVAKIEGYLRETRTDVEHAGSAAAKFARFRRIKNPTDADVKGILLHVKVEKARKILNSRPKWSDDVWRAVLHSRLVPLKCWALNMIVNLQLGDFELARNANVDMTQICIARVPFELRLMIVASFSSKRFTDEQLEQLWQNLNREQFQMLADKCIDKRSFEIIEACRSNTSFFWQDVKNFWASVLRNPKQISKIVECFAAFHDIETLVIFAAPFVPRSQIKLFFWNFRNILMTQIV